MLLNYVGVVVSDDAIRTIIYWEGGELLQWALEFRGDDEIFGVRCW